jgi:hypothetical protein
MRPAHVGRKVDGNQGEIVDALRARGAKVEPRLAACGGGVCDLLVGYKRQLAVAEAKPGDASNKAQRELNANEVKWHEEWGEFPVYLWLSPKEALETLDAFDKLGQWPMKHRSFTKYQPKEQAHGKAIGDSGHGANDQQEGRRRRRAAR